MQRHLDIGHGIQYSASSSSGKFVYHGGNGFFAQQRRNSAQAVKLLGLGIGENRQRSAEGELISAAENLTKCIHGCGVFVSRVARGSVLLVQ